MDVKEAKRDGLYISVELAQPVEIKPFSDYVAESLARILKSRKMEVTDITNIMASLPEDNSAFGVTEGGRNPRDPDLIVYGQRGPQDNYTIFNNLSLEEKELKKLAIELQRGMPNLQN